MSTWYEVTIPVTIKVWGDDKASVEKRIDSDLADKSFTFKAYPDWFVRGNIEVKEAKT